METFATAVSFSSDFFTVSFRDGRSLTVPIDWFPRILSASQRQREDVRISANGQGLHWSEIDEGVSVTGLLHGQRSQEAR